MSHMFARRTGRWSLLLAITASLLFTSAAWAQDPADPPATDTPAVTTDADPATTDTEPAKTDAEPALTEGATEDKKDDAAAPPADGKEEAEDKTPATAEQELAFSFNAIILFICAVLVIFMQAGFAMLEAGFNEAKNVVNILCKNLMDLCVGILLFFFIGYGLMYPGDTKEKWNGYFAYGGPVAFETTTEKKEVVVEKDGKETKEMADVPTAAFNAQVKDAGFPMSVKWLFQVAFAATAATIVSGAVAGRMKFGAYMVYTAFLTGLIYPISGSWQWGGGWLAQAGYHDFAGSVIVHAVGGFAGLAGAIVLGPRLGRFSSDGKSKPILGHNMTFSTLGVFILLIGWYGFNPGSQLAFTTAADGQIFVEIAANTTLAAAGGGVVALLVAWLLFGKPDLSMGLNGVLAGLVGVTANCDCVSPTNAIIIGGIAGVLVVLGILLLDKLKIDDPVGAWPVHGLCGIWGCLAAGIFGGKDLGTQVWASAVICAWAFVTMFILFSVLKAVGQLRVSPEDEQSGLDISEHGMHAYGKPAA